MSSRNQQSNAAPDGGENPCVVCFKNVQIYSIGVCDHPVCYDCSTRMRVLCKQRECPICRGDMPKVIYTKEKKPYAELMKRVEAGTLQESRFGLYFCSPSVQKAYHRLLEFSCQVCRDERYPFKNFAQLRDHMRRDHELFYCDLCVDNLKIFAFERRCYTRSELAQHRRKGDTDNTSHRGHPLCEFCDQRYMDSDELFRHLRRDHLYCHFCDADGKHQYYATYDDLRVHFLDEHFLCEEGDCRNEQFTSVFRTDIDYKAHVASVHSKHLGKAATKHARTLEVEFNFAPRRNNNNDHHHQGRQRGRHRNNDDGNIEDNYSTEPGGSVGGGGAAAAVFANPLRDANFPSLNGPGEASAMAPGTSRTSVTFTSKLTPKFTGDEFPSLGGAQAPKSNVTITNHRPKKGDDFPNLSQSSRNITITKTTASAAGAGPSAANLVKTKQNFPALGKDTGGSSSTVKFTLNQERAQSSVSSSTGTNLSIRVDHKPNGLTTRISTAPTVKVRPPPPAEAFPALGSQTIQQQQQQWVQPKQKKHGEVKVSKVAPAPQLPPSSGFDDFPSLSRNNNNNIKTKKSSSVTVPIAGNVNGGNNKKKTTSSIINNSNFAESIGSSNNYNNNNNGTSKQVSGEDKKKKSSSVTVAMNAGGVNSVNNGNNKQAGEEKKKSKNKNKVGGEGSAKLEEAEKKGLNLENGEGRNKSKKNKKNKTTGGGGGSDEENSRVNNDEHSKLKSGSNDESNKLRGGNDELSVKVKGGVDENDKNLVFKLGGGRSDGETVKKTAVKKTSTLQIGNLEIPESSKRPPGIQVKPPPGFNLLPPKTDLTFTSSSGQSYSILPSYSPPANFNARNSSLVSSFVSVLKTNEALNEFKSYSDLFRKGCYPAREYYEHCRVVLGEGFTRVFPELLVLLPNIERQQELFGIYKERTGAKDLMECASCKQVIFSRELKQHQAGHFMENHFPSLGRSTETAANVWRK